MQDSATYPSAETNIDYFLLIIKLFDYQYNQKPL